MPEISLSLSDDIKQKLDIEVERTGARSRQEVIRHIIAETLTTEEQLRAMIFVRHITQHLREGEKVMCKICGKTIDQIVEEFKHES